MITSYPARRADVVEHAITAPGRARDAHSPAVEYQQVRDLDPVLARNETHQHLLDLCRVRLVGEDEPDGKTADMRVYDDTLAHAERITEHDVGGLAADAGQQNQLGHRPRYFAGMSFDYSRRHSKQALRLVAKKTGAPDHLLESLDLGTREIARTWKCAKELRRYHVDPLVGALRAENRRDEQLKRRLEVELGSCVGVLALETGENFQRVGFQLGAA